MYGCQKVIFSIVKHIVTHGHPGGHKFCDTTFYQFLGQFRIFKLVTNSHPPTRSDQFGQISIQCMMRKSGHLYRITILSSVISLSQSYSQYFRSYYSILTVGFIKVATSEQHNSIRMFGFQIKKLFHHWG